MDSKKKVKSKNFTVTEENHLILLVKKYWSVLGNKKTDSDANRTKKEYWLFVEQEFNVEANECYRPSSVLKGKFENICRRATDKRAKIKKHNLGTGGGEGTDVQMNATDEMALALLGARATGLQSNWCDDEDSITEIDNIPIEDEEDLDNDLEQYVQVDFDDELPNENDNNLELNYISSPVHTKAKMCTSAAKVNAGASTSKVGNVNWENMTSVIKKKVLSNLSTAKICPTFTPSKSNSADWGKYTPAMLKKQKSLHLKNPQQCVLPDNVEVASDLPLHSKRRKLFEDKLANWAGEKVKNTQLQEEIIKKRSVAKEEILQIQVEKEKCIAELLKKEIELRIEQSIEKHAAEMELFRLQKRKLLNEFCSD